MQLVMLLRQYIQFLMITSTKKFNEGHGVMGDGKKTIQVCTHPVLVYFREMYFRECTL